MQDTLKGPSPNPLPVSGERAFDAVPKTKEAGPSRDRPLAVSSLSRAQWVSRPASPPGFAGGGTSASSVHSMGTSFSTSASSST